MDDEDGGPGIYRVEFSPAEIYQFVRGIAGWDEYSKGGFEAVSDRALAAEAQESASERRGYDPGACGVCAADFLGEDVEALVRGWRLTKAHRVRANGPHDAMALIHAMTGALPTASKVLTDRGGDRKAFEITSERDVQDLIYFFLRNAFEDAKKEVWTPGAAGDAKRIDLMIPSERILIEVKFVRDSRHAKRVADPQAVERGLSGVRTKGNTSFDVVVRVT
ncbi:MAG: hypothetical protein JSU06_20160 [Actinobacteria bacterium]|nr:hypothetical protein [Actinomycetota bacterium]